MMVVKRLFGCEERRTTTTATVLFIFRVFYFYVFLYILKGESSENELVQLMVSSFSKAQENCVTSVIHEGRKNMPGI